MGICYQGKTFKEVVEERDQLFEETGYCYGLEKLELAEEDPAKFMRFQLRLVSACVNARETAKLITANPMGLLMGELIFMLANTDGDCVSASFGLYGHIQCFPYIIKSIADLGFEEDPGIREGDIFATNDPMYGAPHNIDNYTWVPVFHKGELIAWSVGINHILDVGALQPSTLSSVSPNTFTDGFMYPPMKTGDNFKQHKWWELFWKRRTRAEEFNIMDDKMRVAGAVAIHDRVLEIVEEFGVDYFRKGLKEVVERERRQLLQRIKAQAIPGIYNYLQFGRVKYKGLVGRLFPSANRDWMLHIPVELNILPDGRLLFDMEGLTSEDEFHCNIYEPGLRMCASMGMWPMFAHTRTINTGLRYMNDWNVPPGSMYNPQDEHRATIMGLSDAAKTMFAVFNCFTYAYFFRGFLEESFPQEGGSLAYGMDGVLEDGYDWTGGDMLLVAATGSNACPYKDGVVALWAFPNPASDMGETEASEFTQPTNLNIGRKLIPNYCGHGKYRGALGMGITQVILDPGQKLTMAAFVGQSGVGNTAIGMAGGYPGQCDLIYFGHDTNMREILDGGLPYPTDFVQIKECIKEGKLKVGSSETYNLATPNVDCRDGDIFAVAAGAKGGWGDPLEREFGLVENDLRYGWITPDVAKQVYGVVTDEKGKVKEKESEELRQQMRDRRKERSVDAREWWRQEREQVLGKEFSEDVYNMYADCLQYEKFRRQFMGMWQLPEDYKL